jgi:hypothetical protein
VIASEHKESVMRDYILNWIETYRSSNTDLFYTKLGKKDEVNQHGIKYDSRPRWPKDFDFSKLNDDELIVEFTKWMIYSMRQR